MKAALSRSLLIAASAAFLFVMLALPLATVLAYAFRQGWAAFAEAAADAYALKALGLTLLATACAVLVNTVFGAFAAWAITKYRFRGKSALSTLIDIPFSISPVIAGLTLILVFGRIGWMHPLLEKWGVKVVFATPGIVLATIFVTFPFVARELIPLMSSQGPDEEEAAALLGAGGFRIFWKVTFPQIKWALLYGSILTASRALGEFGAVSVVSGHLRGKTNTLPLHVEILFNEFRATAAFAVSTILAALAIAALIARNIVEGRVKREEEGL
jgi:sulfate transport system permease protein